MTSDAVRWVRALTLASVLFTGGLAGHAAADGFTPAVSVLILLFVLTVVAVGPFVGAPLNLARTVALLLGGQLLLHAALQLLSRSAVEGMPTPPPSVALAPSSHPMDCSMTMYPGAPAPPGSAMPLVGGGHVVMLLAHLAAAIAVGVWLVVGERVLWTLLALTARPVVNAWRIVRDLAREGFGAVVIDCSHLLARWRPRSAVHGSVWTAGVGPRRGPPAAALPETHGYAALLAI
jgi:hypothetical protein